MDSVVLFARTEHGGHRVVRKPREIQIEWPGGPRVYSTVRRAIIALYSGEPDPPPDAYDPHLAFDRYFRRGRYRRRPVPPAIDVLEMFQPDPPNQVSISTPSAPVFKSGLTVHIPARGIDLSKRALEVRKVFFAGFARKVAQLGYDPEDVLQEVYQGILVRNQGKCPFDPKKSSFGHYVHMVAGCILSNYRRRYSRLSRNEQFGVLNASGEEVDVALGDLARIDPTQDTVCGFSLYAGFLQKAVRATALANGVDPHFAERCLWLLSKGHLYREIAAELDCKISDVSSTVRMIRGLRNQMFEEC